VVTESPSSSSCSSPLCPSSLPALLLLLLLSLPSPQSSSAPPPPPPPPPPIDAIIPHFPRIDISPLLPFLPRVVVVASDPFAFSAPHCEGEFSLSSEFPLLSPLFLPRRKEEEEEEEGPQLWWES